MNITPDQLASVLAKAMNLRPDVRKATAAVAAYDPALLIVTVSMYDGKHLHREARVSKCLDGRTVGEVLEAWLGPVPARPPMDRSGESDRLRGQRFLLWNMTPPQALAALRDRARPEPQGVPAPTAAERPSSEGLMPRPIPDPTPPPRPESADG